MKTIFTILFLLLSVTAAFTQNTAVSASKDQIAKNQAKATLTAHGGDKLKNVRSLIFRGSVDVTSATFAQAIPGSFVMVFSGDKYRFELLTAFQPIKQAFDGKVETSNVSGNLRLPPINRLGFPLLSRIGDEGFIVTAIPESEKKGFRITAPDGYFTDFVVDEKSDLLKGYNSGYSMNGTNVTTAVEIDKTITVDGVIVPERYSQRFDFVGNTFYADFKSKEVLVNSPIEDAVFVITK